MCMDCECAASLVRVWAGWGSHALTDRSSSSRFLSGCQRLAIPWYAVRISLGDAVLVTRKMA